MLVNLVYLRAIFIPFLMGWVLQIRSSNFSCLTWIDGGWEASDGFPWGEHFLRIPSFAWGGDVAWQLLYRPEYAVYAKGYGHGMVDYMANVWLPSRLTMVDEEIDKAIREKGTSMDMAIQSVAYQARVVLREELVMLELDSF